MNSSWQIDLFDGLNHATNMQDVLDSTLKVVKKFGFDYVAWRTELPLPITRKKTLALGTIEKDGVIEKASEGYYDNMPVPQHCSKTMDPISWLGTTDDYVFSKSPDLMEEYYSTGRYGGWAQSLIESSNIFSLFWVDTSCPITQKDIDHVSLEMEWISTAVLSKMNQVRVKSNIILSEREKEVLRWTGDGKTASEISQILYLSQSTVNFHIRNAMIKLDAPNKTNAIVKAIYLGLLHH